MLQSVDVSFENAQLPPDVTRFVKELEERLALFLEGKPFAQDGFVACDHRAVAKALIGVQQTQLASGNSFCEWGSGFGGVASVASLLGFESYGIEINLEILRHSVRLAEDFELSVEFVEGSFIPVGSDDLVDSAFIDNDGDLTLECHFDDAYQAMGLEVSDFDVIFVFPWPTEAALLANIFDRFASSGALLLIYNDFSGLNIQRKL